MCVLMTPHVFFSCVCVFVPVCSGGIEDPDGVCVGDREGNRWLQYDSNNLPLSEEQWDSQQFVEKTHWGYYSWPRYRERVFRLWI